MTDDILGALGFADDGEAPEDIAVFVRAFANETEFDPARMVSLRASTGSRFDITLDDDEPVISIRDLLSKGQLAIGQGVQFFVNETEVSLDFEVAPGAVVIALGTVKGA